MKKERVEGPFTKADALALQKEHLAQWETVLKPECFAKLKAWAERSNDKVTDPYDIRRGNALDNYIANLANGSAEWMDAPDYKDWA